MSKTWILPYFHTQQMEYHSFRFPSSRSKWLFICLYQCYLIDDSLSERNNSGITSHKVNIAIEKVDILINFICVCVSRFLYIYIYFWTFLTIELSYYFSIFYLRTAQEFVFLWLLLYHSFFTTRIQPFISLQSKQSESLE